MQDFEADGLYVVGDDVKGLFFKEEVRLPFLRCKMKLEPDGYGYVPSRNTRRGKELANRLIEGKELHFSPSRHICDKLDIHRYQSDGTYVYRTVAGYADGKILVSIPGPRDGMVGMSDPFPEVPAWLREVKESEWLAAQGK